MVALTKPRWPLPRPDLGLARQVSEAIDPPLKRYFRYQVEGLDLVPKGRALLAGNHSGGFLPMDSLLFGLGFHQHYDFQRPIHFLVHDLLFRLPRRAREVFTQLGMVRANPGAAESLLRQGRTVMVYPGGAHEVYRPFWERHTVDWSNHMGYIRLAVRTRSPVVPVAGIGGHETLFVLTRGRWLARWLGIPAHFKRISILPFSFGLPFGISMGPIPPHFPLPAQITLRVLEPMELHNLPAGRALFRRDQRGDPEHLAELHRLVQAQVQAGLDDLARDRIPFVGQIRTR